ncbi:GNAT family N-acetyltransferase [bacterium]|nr:MAG: GNAT family N-acetyltransferase [bacterium]
MLEERCDAQLLVLFELDERAIDNFGEALEKSGHIKAASLPGTKIHIEAEWDGLEGYVGAMRKLYRRAVRDDQAKAQELDIQIETDFAELADEVFVLYSNVLARAQSTFETLTPEFFRAFARCADSRLVTARLKETGQLIGVEMLLLGDNMVQDLYTGVDYLYNESHNVYFNLAYPAIDLACREGMQFVSTGQTSYKFKSRLGVKPFQLSVYIKHRNLFVNALLSRLHPFICPEVPTFEHRVFKSEAHHVNTAAKSKEQKNS